MISTLILRLPVYQYILAVVFWRIRKTIRFVFLI